MHKEDQVKKKNKDDIGCKLHDIQVFEGCNVIGVNEFAQLRKDLKKNKIKTNYIGTDVFVTLQHMCQQNANSY